MILTTNQIAEFDIAIPSRIHVAIKYDGLDKGQMRNIFDGFLAPLDDQDLIEDYEGIKKWLKQDVFTYQFDGRQIRNIVTTALSLARAESKDTGKNKLKLEHLKEVALNSRAFNEEWLTRLRMHQQAQSMKSIIR
jgi:hypothetical protein